VNLAAEKGLTLFIDAQCALCAKEMRHLKQHDTDHVITLVDINAADFSENYPTLNYQACMAQLHGQLASGKLIKGLDATHAAWTLVGLGHRTAFLRGRFIKPISDRVYGVFAKHRHSISALFGGRKTACQCANRKPLTDTHIHPEQGGRQ